MVIHICLLSNIYIYIYIGIQVEDTQHELQVLFIFHRTCYSGWQSTIVKTRSYHNIFGSPELIELE